ncbi:hypothetical protein AVEN_248369-1 [Araneus ventricosus]|uniref:Uncharacterized protein n=1 Tax=Araneus ventricosus TaxID=182803 RepID=A0A4Y2MF94_ARAVE|nr:hypothetical protein AVEN_248369-1 [Araneus ventricosus]
MSKIQGPVSAVVHLQVMSHKATTTRTNESDVESSVLSHNQNRPTSTSGLNEKNRSSVDRTREFSPQSLVVITIDKRALARFLSSSKNLSLHPRSSLFKPHLLLTGGAIKSRSTNPRQSCRWSLFQRAIIGSLPFGPSPAASGFSGWR